MANLSIIKPLLAKARAASCQRATLNTGTYVRLSVAKIPKKTRFAQKFSNLELWCLLTTYRYMAFQRTNYWTPKIQDGRDRHLENRHNVIFFCRGWSDLDKISQTGAE